MSASIVSGSHRTRSKANEEANEENRQFVGRSAEGYQPAADEGDG
jgi:hypothetical protein